LAFNCGCWCIYITKYIMKYGLPAARKMQNIQKGYQTIVKIL